MKREDVLILLSFLLFVQGYLFENVFPALLAFSVLTYLTYLRSEFTPKIAVERSIDSKLKEGVWTISKLKLRNLANKKFVVSVSEDFLPPGFKADVPPPFMLEEMEEREVGYPVFPVKGTYRIKGPKVRVMDLRGLHHEDFISDSEIEIEVYPSLDRVKDDVKAEQNIKLASVYKRALLGFQTPEIYSLRRFQLGDDTRHVEWKATARLGELIIKDFIKEREGDVYIILDAGKDMRKGVKTSKIDYATTLTLQIAFALRDHRVGLIVYDDLGVKQKVGPSKSPEQLEKIVRSLKISPVYSDLLSVKLPELTFKLSEGSRNFLRKILPVYKGRAGFSSGLIEAISNLPSSAFLVFISDITAHTSEILRVMSKIKDRYRVMLLTPNPVLFYDESKLDKETLLWLYKRYLEREELVKKLNKLVPTLDLGPSDLLDAIRGAIK